ncbi:type II secretion system protein E [bacterium BMS3Bbin11]|nr:type II secretion system protein E [bacterium BMS3Abin11]GBE45866.1 type II secretion system protein E [bacterium BMS3Bbin11]HDH08817.1 type IV-A pilus assembly ATPase PilB [Gammaproteobacteria bacterium]HDH16532.1 type IV-A pilus assembly ATPase PilB [Gammaproteobacteria bacterium]HDZ78449.1 type IV-A pilus assembly ATPase PilB [Gammaproteobacteria bacterium]
MSTPATAMTLTGLPLRLVGSGVFFEDEVQKLLKSVEGKKKSFFTAAIEKKPTKNIDICFNAAEEYGLPLIDVRALDPEALEAGLLSEKIIRKHRVLPIQKRGNKLYVAVSDPTNLAVLDEIRFSTGTAVEAIVAEPARLEKLIDVSLDKADTSLADLAGQDLDDIDIGVNEDESSAGAADEAQADAPVVRFVNKVILDAVNTGASDIHIEPYEKTFRIRYRVDGVLHIINNPPPALARRLAARIKILSRLDIAERRVPQDGRMQMRLSKNRAIDFRVSTCPTMYGEKVVIRILDPSATTVGVENLGFEPEQKEIYMDAIARPDGMVLVTGPTGSGKTVTLYTALRILNSEEKNLSTVEDPVEINVTGVNQVQINEKAGMLFSTALRSFLRQDPDIIMVGEIRDLETAEIAIKAAQTGHLVLSTLHTNDAPSTLTRLVNMGVPAFNIASSVHLIIAQRLARRLCTVCKKKKEYPESVLTTAGFKPDELEDLEIYEPKGCDNCTNGYKGRVGIFQLLPLSDTMAELIMKGGTEADINRLAEEEGHANLRQAGLVKMRQGLTSLEEIERVTNN